MTYVNTGIYTSILQSETNSLIKKPENQHGF